MESEAPNATPLPGRVPSTVHRFPGGYTPQSRARRPQRSPATSPLSISRRPLSNGRRSAEPEFADRLVAGRPRAEAVGEAVPDLERVDELHRGLDSLPAGPLEADEDGDPVRPLGDPLRDHLDLLPGLVEVGPPAPDALFALVDGLEAGEDAAGVILDLGVTNREQRLEVVLVPGAVAALGELRVAELLGHDREPIAPSWLSCPSAPSGAGRRSSAGSSRPGPGRTPCPRSRGRHARAGRPGRDPSDGGRSSAGLRALVRLLGGTDSGGLRRLIRRSAPAAIEPGQAPADHGDQPERDQADAEVGGQREPAGDALLLLALEVLLVEDELAAHRRLDRDPLRGDCRVLGHEDRESGDPASLVQAERRFPGAVHGDRLGDPVGAGGDGLELLDDALLA